MRRVWLGMALVAVSLTSCAATPLRVSLTMPVNDNAAVCNTTPLTGPMFAPEGLRLRLYAQRQGNARVDSLTVANLSPGQRLDTLVILPDAAPGFWTVTAWVLKPTAGKLYLSCPATAVDTISSKPDAITFR